MKIKYLLIIAICCCFYNCDEDLMDYEGQDGLYFAVQQPWKSGAGDTTRWEYRPESVVSFIMTTKLDTTIKIRVNVLGKIREYDRYFSVELIDTGTTAVAGREFDALEDNYIIKGGTHYTDIIIGIHKNPAINNTSKHLTIRLKQTEDFSLPIDMWRPMPGQSYYSETTGGERVDIKTYEHKIVLSDILVDQPAGWWAGLMGDFTKTKFDFLCQNFNLTYMDFESMSVMNSTKARVIAENAQSLLDELESKGETVYDEDGEPMKMGEYL